MCLPSILPHIIGRADTRVRPYGGGLQIYVCRDMTYIITNITIRRRRGRPMCLPFILPHIIGTGRRFANISYAELTFLYDKNVTMSRRKEIRWMSTS